MYTNRGTNVPRTSLPCPPRYGNSTRRRFAKALGANHLLVYYRSGGGSTGLRQVRPPLLSHTILTRETGTKIHMYRRISLYSESVFSSSCLSRGISPISRVSLVCLGCVRCYPCISSLGHPCDNNTPVLYSFAVCVISSLHQPLAQHQPSRIRPVNAETFDHKNTQNVRRSSCLSTTNGFIPGGLAISSSGQTSFYATTVRSDTGLDSICKWHK